MLEFHIFFKKPLSQHFLKCVVIMTTARFGEKRGKLEGLRTGLQGLHHKLGHKSQLMMLVAS